MFQVVPYLFCLWYEGMGASMLGSQGGKSHREKTSGQESGESWGKYKKVLIIQKKNENAEKKMYFHHESEEIYPSFFNFFFHLRKKSEIGLGKSENIKFLNVVATQGKKKKTGRARWFILIIHLL